MSFKLAAESLQWWRTGLADIMWWWWWWWWWCARDEQQYETEIQRQRDELAELTAERQRLVVMQQHLLSLQQSLTAATSVAAQVSHWFMLTLNLLNMRDGLSRNLLNCNGSHASLKVLDFFFKFPWSGKSGKMSLVLESPGN